MAGRRGQRVPLSHHPETVATDWLIAISARKNSSEDWVLRTMISAPQHNSVVSRRRFGIAGPTVSMVGSPGTTEGANGSPARSVTDRLARLVSESTARFGASHAQFDVSIAALLRRALTLGRISQHSYVNAMKTMSARGWRINEPGDEKLGPMESPVLLRLALDRLTDAGIGLGALAVEASSPTFTTWPRKPATRDHECSSERSCTLFSPRCRRRSPAPPANQRQRPTRGATSLTFESKAGVWMSTSASSSPSSWLSSASAA